MAPIPSAVIFAVFSYSSFVGFRAIFKILPYFPFPIRCCRSSILCCTAQALSMKPVCSSFTLDTCSTYGSNNKEYIKNVAIFYETRSMPYSFSSRDFCEGPNICLDFTPVITSMARMVFFMVGSMVVPQMIRAFLSIFV